MHTLICCEAAWRALRFLQVLLRRLDTEHIYSTASLFPLSQTAFLVELIPRGFSWYSLLRYLRKADLKVLNRKPLSLSTYVMKGH